MAAIKRFFEKKKLDIKFKKAGGGHKLTEESQRSVPSVSHSHGASGSRKPAAGQTAEQQRAAAAALARMDKPRPGSAIGTSMATIRAQVKREMETTKAAAEQQKATTSAFSEPDIIEREAAPQAGPVLFRCALVGGESLPRSDMETLIHEFLLTQLADEPQMTSALIIHTENKDKARVKAGIDIICKYLENMVAHPGEEKYQRIRINNKVFSEKVGSLEGSQEFLQSAGFEVRSLLGPNDVEEDFYVMNSEVALDGEQLKALQDVLHEAEPIRPELDPCIHVFYPSPQASHMVVPNEFYTISPEELKRQQREKAEASEKLGMLRTKEMREREAARELRRYRYTLIRVRFPDGVLLQATFRALDKLPAVTSLLRECLVNDWMPFQLSTATGQKLDDEELSMTELGLAPAAIVNFSWDASILKEVAAQQGGSEGMSYLKDEIMAQIESL